VLLLPSRLTELPSMLHLRSLQILEWKVTSLVHSRDCNWNLLILTLRIYLLEISTILVKQRKHPGVPRIFGLFMRKAKKSILVCFASM
jgi:hypothetical protein